MRKTLSTLLVLFLTALAALAADVSGNWKATITGMDGNPMEVKMALQAAGSVLTGTVSVMGMDMKVENGKLDGDKVTFQVKPQMPGGGGEGPGAGAPPMVVSYEGTVSGDDLKLRVKMGENTQPLNLKRVK